MQKVCKKCGKEFETYHSEQQYCCRECSPKKKKLPRLKYQCEECLETFISPTPRRFCSKSCKAKWQGKRINNFKGTNNE